MAPKKRSTDAVKKVKNLKPAASQVKGGRTKWGDIVLKRGYTNG